MERRDFLKKTGAGLATLALSGSSYAENQATEEILAGADERVKKHRQAHVTLKLSGPDGKAMRPSVPIKIEQTNHEFLFGCNIFKLNRCNSDQNNVDYAEHFSDLLNFATLPFYWWDYEREKGKPADQRTQETLAWCKAQQIKAKGHPLAWNYIQPRWLAKENPETAMQLQLERITRCVKMFAGEIDVWDVVNEATHYDRDQCRKDAPALTQAISNMGVGEYLRQAFKTARAANPKGTLIINDYRTDVNYEKKVIAELTQPGRKPLYDVIGIQSHMHNNYWGAKRTWDVCDTYAKYDVPLHFTEATVVSGPKSNDEWKTTSHGEVEQAQAVSEFYTVLFSHPAVEAITWWDFTDQNAWQKAPAGLIRADMSPKPAYHRLKELIKGKWWTKTQSLTTAHGQIDFTGYKGDYRLSTHIDGRQVSATFTLAQTKPGIIALKLMSSL